MVLCPYYVYIYSNILMYTIIYAVFILCFAIVLLGGFFCLCTVLKNPSEGNVPKVDSYLIFNVFIIYRARHRKYIAIGI